MKISVITPVYNRADCIIDCMESVTNATKGNIEIEHVICDDGSTDNTVDIIKQYALTHPHIILEQLAHNSGPNAARNKAIEAASGEWILFLDSDDRLTTDSFLTYEKVMTRYPGYKHYLFNCDDWAQSNEKYGDTHIFTFDDFLYGRVHCDFNHLFLRSTALALPFDNDVRVHEGVFFLRFYRMAGKILYSNHVTDLLDRNRDDHASFYCRKTTDRALLDEIRSKQLYISFFENELNATPQGRDILTLRLNQIYTNTTLLGRYGEAAEALAKIKALNLPRPPRYITLCNKLHMGRPAWSLLKTAIKLRWKYRTLLTT